MSRGDKRRCAGCNAVIEGRPNKLYCSYRCRDKARYQRKTVGKNTTVSGAIPSVIRGTNGVLLARVARLGYLGGPGAMVLDMTYGRGLWWTRYRPERLIAAEGDFRHRPEADDSVDVVVFDPPYISTGNRDKSSVLDLYERFGLGEARGWRAIRQQMDEGLAECARLLRPGGYLLAKCMDYVESGHKIWNTFHLAAYGEEALGLELLDRIHHVSTGKGGPQPGDNLDGSPRQQKHAREVASMLLVFTKRVTANRKRRAFAAARRPPLPLGGEPPHQAYHE